MTNITEKQDWDIKIFDGNDKVIKAQKVQNVSQKEAREELYKAFLNTKNASDWFFAPVK